MPAKEALDEWIFRDHARGLAEGDGRLGVRRPGPMSSRPLRKVRLPLPEPGAHDTDPATDYVRESEILVRRAADEIATELKAIRDQHLEVPVCISVQCGHPAEVLARAGTGARLIVVGAHRGHLSLSLGVGPVLHALLARATTPVAVIPTH
jgi:nucleotide-binding universal stress UspA family protein